MSPLCIVVMWRFFVFILNPVGASSVVGVSIFVGTSVVVVGASAVVGASVDGFFFVCGPSWFVWANGQGWLLSTWVLGLVWRANGVVVCCVLGLRGLDQSSECYFDGPTILISSRDIACGEHNPLVISQLNVGEAQKPL